MTRFLGVVLLMGLTWVPGYATVLLLSAGSKGRRTLDDGLEALALQIALGLTVGGIGALFLALTGVFNAFSWAGLMTLYSLLMLFFGKLRGGSFRRALPSIRLETFKEHFGILVILLVGFILVISPFMTVFAERDDGVYSNTAAMIRNTGGIHYTDTFMKEVQPDEWVLFYRSDRPAPALVVQEEGFYVTDFQKGSIIPQFVFLYPAMLATFMTFLGFKGGFFLLSLLTVFCTLALYLIGSKLVNKYCGLLAAGLLAVNIIQLYFGKWTGPEVLVEFFFLFGMYCFLVYMDVVDGRTGAPLWLWGIGAGLLLGCTMMAHIDMFLIFVPFLLFAAYMFIEGGARQLWNLRHFLLTFVAVSGLAIWLGFVVSGIYANAVYSYVFTTSLPGGWKTVGLGAFLVVAAALILRWPLHGAYLFLRKHRNSLLVVIALVLICLAVFGWFIRPAMYSPTDVRGIALRAKVFPVFAFYLTPLGVVLALAGYCMFLLRSLDRRSLFMVATGLTFSLMILYKPFAAWSLIYTMRRMVPVILPMAILMAAYVVVESVDFARTRLRKGLRVATRVVVAGAAVALIVWSALISGPIWRIDEGYNSLGLSHRIADLAEGESSLVIFDYKSGHIISSPVRYVWQKNVVKMRSQRLKRAETFRSFIDREIGKRSVYLVTMGESPDLTQELKLQLIGETALTGTFLEETVDAPSLKTSRWQTEAFRVFRVLGVS